MRSCTVLDADNRGDLMDFGQLSGESAYSLRKLFREGRWTGSTGGLAPKNLQANLTIVPSDLAHDFARFCVLNPKPCPLVEISAKGSKHFLLGAESNFYTDLPRYRVIRGGTVVDEPSDVLNYYSDESVGFLLGCSVTFETVLVSNGVPVRHLEKGYTAPMYRTGIQCIPVGDFRGPQVVTMRAIPKDKVQQAIDLTARLPEAHGTPIHVGDPYEIGVNLETPDYGDAPIIHDGDLPVFWACGVTPQEVAVDSKLDMITHFPGAMFISDKEMEI